MTSCLDDVSGTCVVTFLDDSTRPPVPMDPPQTAQVKPQDMQHACEYCLVGESSTRCGLLLCGSCKTARYCNTECQGKDWPRHKGAECTDFHDFRVFHRPLHQVRKAKHKTPPRAAPHRALLWMRRPVCPGQACLTANMVEVRRLVDEEKADVNATTTSGGTALCAAATKGHLLVVQVRPMPRSHTSSPPPPTPPHYMIPHLLRAVPHRAGGGRGAVWPEGQRAPGAGGGARTPRGNEAGPKRVLKQRRNSDALTAIHGATPGPMNQCRWWSTCWCTARPSTGPTEKAPRP